MRTFFPFFGTVVSPCIGLEMIHCKLHLILTWNPERVPCEWEKRYVLYWHQSLLWRVWHLHTSLSSGKYKIQSMKQSAYYSREYGVQIIFLSAAEIRSIKLHKSYLSKKSSELIKSFIFEYPVGVTKYSKKLNYVSHATI